MYLQYVVRKTICTENRLRRTVILLADVIIVIVISIKKQFEDTLIITLN